jgi:hypothetical protein
VPQPPSASGPQVQPVPTAPVDFSSTSSPWTGGWASGTPTWRKSYTPLPGQSGCFNRCRPGCRQAYGAGYGCNPVCRASCNIRPTCGLQSNTQWSGNTMVCGRPPYNANNGGFTDGSGRPNYNGFNDFNGGYNGGFTGGFRKRFLLTSQMVLVK